MARQLQRHIFGLSEELGRVAGQQVKVVHPRGARRLEHVAPHQVVVAVDQILPRFGLVVLFLRGGEEGLNWVTFFVLLLLIAKLTWLVQSIFGALFVQSCHPVLHPVLHVLHIYQILVAIRAILGGLLLLQQIVPFVLLLLLLVAIAMLQDSRGRMVHRVELELMPGAISAAGSVLLDNKKKRG